MRALILYETMFGDARAVAQSIGAGLGDAWGPAARVEVLEIGAAPVTWDSGVDLLVLGSPNHAFSLPRAQSRKDAAAQTGRDVISSGIGVREWLGTARLPTGQPSAAFDTRMDHPRILVRMDHASKLTEKGLRGLGASVVAPAQHFVVTDTTGPLADGEPERAQTWGRTLAGLVVSSG